MGTIYIDDSAFWDNLITTGSYFKEFICGFCTTRNASTEGYLIKTGNNKHHNVTNIKKNQCGVFICNSCKKPNYFDIELLQFPTPDSFKQIKHLPEDIEIMYREAINCYKYNAPNACLMVCRKILLHIVDDFNSKLPEAQQKKVEKLNFLSCIDFIIEQNIVSINIARTVDHIRVEGNEANHRINIKDLNTSKKVLSLVEHILYDNYEVSVEIDGNEV